MSSRSAEIATASRRFLAATFLLVLDQVLASGATPASVRAIVSSIMEKMGDRIARGRRRVVREGLAATAESIRIALKPVGSAGRRRLADTLKSAGQRAVFADLIVAGCAPAGLLIGLIDALVLRTLPGKTNPLGMPLYSFRRFPKRLDNLASEIERVLASEMWSAIDRVAVREQRYEETVRIHRALPQYLRHFALNIRESLGKAPVPERRIAHWANPKTHDRLVEQRLVYWVERETGRPQYASLGRLLDRDAAGLRGRTVAFRRRRANRELLEGEFGSLQSGSRRRGAEKETIR